MCGCSDHGDYIVCGHHGETIYMILVTMENYMGLVAVGGLNVSQHIR